MNGVSLLPDFPTPALPNTASFTSGLFAMTTRAERANHRADRVTVATASSPPETDERRKTADQCLIQH